MSKIIDFQKAKKKSEQKKARISKYTNQNNKIYNKKNYVSRRIMYFYIILLSVITAIVLAKNLGL